MPDSQERKFNILYVFGGEKAQGAEIVIERLMNHNLAQANAHLFISPGRFADDLISNNKPYQITRLSYLKKLNRSKTGAFKFYLQAISNYFGVSYKVYRYIKAHKINVVHANTIVPASYLLPVIIFSRLFGSKIKWVWSDHDITYYSKLDHLLSGFCVKWYDFTLVVSKAVKKKYPDNDKIRILYNGLDTDVFKPDDDQKVAFRTKYSLPENAIVLGMPAVVAPRKGQLQLINAFNSIYPAHPNIFLLFAGGYEEATPEYGEMVQQAISKNKRIIHLGLVSNMSEFYNGCDIIVNNSNISGSEPLGTTIYEAMACEKLVIASITGGTPEIITDHTDGFLFEAENEGQLATLIDYVVRNINGLKYIRLAARNTVKKRFAIEEMAKEYNILLKTA